MYYVLVITWRVFLRAILPLVLLIGSTSTLAADAALRFGVFPQLSVRAMVETYQPLVDYLADSIKQPVNLESAADFYTFHKRTLDGEYDVLLTAPHLAWLAWKEGKYRPILTYQEPARGYVVVRGVSPYWRLADLRGASIATPDPLAIINIRLERDLVKAGLKLDRDVSLIAVGTHSNAATYVIDKQSDAAIVGVFPYLRLPQKTRDDLRIIAETPALPSHAYLVHPRMTREQERAISQAIEKFMQDDVGQAFLKKTGFGGVRPLKKNELRQVEVDAEEFKRRFEAQERTAGKEK